MQEINVSGREEGGTLLKLLGKYLKEAPASFFYKMLRKKNITLNGKKAEGGEKLEKGDVIRLFLSDDTIRQFGGAAWLEGKKQDGISEMTAGQPEDGVKGFLSGQESIGTKKTLKKLPKIIYEDDDILLINKPAGWLTQKASPEDFSLNEWLVTYLLSENRLTKQELSTFRPAVCNRLDRNTSGIVSAGKTLAGLQFLSGAFRERTLHKYYTCIVAGEIKKAARMDGALKKDGKNNLVRVLQDVTGAREGYRPVHAAYCPLAVHGGFTYLEVELITGKTHQIRAQLAAKGHAILGDSKYANEVDEKLSRKYHLNHQLLHAGRVIFGEYSGRFSYLNGREFTAKEPEAFQKLKEQLGFCSL